MFLHGGVWHLALNMFILWMFGRELEGIWGEKGFLHYYLTCGIGAGIVTCFSTMGSLDITIGASGAIFGILVAYAVIYPERPITLLLFFVLPITMKTKHLVMGFAALEFLHCISYTPDGIGHFAHLGGGVVGYFYLRMWKRRSFYSTGYGETILSRVREMLQKRKQKQAGDLEGEVDRILDKISKTGLQSLSRREKNLLRKKSTKL
jgi:membrane associated rhomboid family serine protease